MFHFIGRNRIALNGIPYHIPGTYSKHTYPTNTIKTRQCSKNDDSVYLVQLVWNFIFNKDIVQLASVIFVHICYS